MGAPPPDGPVVLARQGGAVFGSENQGLVALTRTAPLPGTMRWQMHRRGRCPGG